MPGLADASTVVSVDRYRQLTGDVTTLAGDVADALDVALGRIQDYLERSLVLDEYTETLPVLKYRVYPTNTPIVSATDYFVRGASLIAVYDSWDAFIPENDVEVTYVGGYDADTIPLSLVDAICKVAYGALQVHQSATTSAPEGVTSVAVGDVRVTYAGSSKSSISSDLPIDIARSIRGFKKQRV